MDENPKRIDVYVNRVSWNECIKFVLENEHRELVHCDDSNGQFHNVIDWVPNDVLLLKAEIAGVQGVALRWLGTI
ncbi:hypothetical protein WA026_014451 [Henosepilachna vigintioctopunctata]|uniref:Uncharacterized protein n=1 Tax=Henosepilachna vigintioctopunctata TaxID=420089 RepID=A0AAW1UM61_9CUCU